MSLGNKKQANIYVPKDLHNLFSNIAKHTPFSVGDLYILSASRILGRIPDLTNEDLDYRKLGVEMFERLNGGRPVLGASNYVIPVETTYGIPAETTAPKRSVPVKIKSYVYDSEGNETVIEESKIKVNYAKKIVKTHRDDDQYLWMLQNEKEVWKPCFDRFTHLARVTAIQSPTDDDLNSVVDDQENLYIITFMGYSNPKKGSYGVYDKEPLLSTNVGFFITTLICGDPEGKRVFAGRSMPRKLFNQLSESDLEKQAFSTPEIMFTKPNHLSEEEAPFWGYCEGALSELEQIFQNHADISYIEQQLESLSEEEDMHDKSFKEVLGIIFADHYGHWQYYLENFEIKTAAENYETKGAEE